MLSANHFYYNSIFRWEKYDAKGSTEKGAYKYGRLNDQSWWEKWGENYDGRGYVLKWSVSFPPSCKRRGPIVMVFMYSYSIVT